MFGKKLCFVFLIAFFSQWAHAQLSNFTLVVAKTDETCNSNASLSFTVSNTTNGATMLFSIFKLPDLVTPISLQSAMSISGLDSGTYRVIATQSLGGDTGSQQQDITIDDLIQSLTYQITSTNEICGNDGTITINTTGGAAVSYEIFSGPMTRPVQPSNLFSGLTEGIYQIRVRDNCNQNVVQTYTLQASSTDLNLNLINPFVGSCTTANVGFNVQSLIPPPNGVIRYPLQVVTTVTPPTGPVLTFNQTLNGGFSFTQQIPLYINQTYSYSFNITDGCGTVYNLSGVVQNLSVRPVTYTVAPEDCTHKILAFSNVGSLILVSAPAGYIGPVPYDFTPMIVNAFINIGSLTAGTYVFNATDVCGNPQQFIIEVVIDQNPTPPSSTIFNQTCIDSSLLIFEIDQLVLVSCPASYGVAVPHDYTGLINAGHYAAFSNLPVGIYIFNTVDRCGRPSPLQVEIVPVSLPPATSVLEGCENGLGSLQITGQLISISLLSAPTAYTGMVPANLTANVISNGTRLTMDMLPPGNYVFQSTNSCNDVITNTITILGYEEETTATVVANCGSFNFTLSHNSNNNGSASFWLQKYNPVSGTWGHPLTNALYSDGTVPTNTNSIQLSNNVIQYNIAVSGHFRVIKVYRSFADSHPSPVNCLRVVYEFDFSGEPKINDIYSISCGQTFEVVVDASGNSVLSYRIISKNGSPFIVENGNSSIFSGLDPAIYVFEVEDVCHNTVNGQFEVSNLDPMQVTASEIPCNGGNFTLSVPNFPFLTYEWWKGNNTSNLLGNSNSLNFPAFNFNTDNGVYYVRISYPENPNSCLNQVLNYTVTIDNNNLPHAGNDNAVSYCGRQGVMDLSTLLTGTFDANGVWTEVTSSGMLTDNLWDSSDVLYGTYQFRYKVTGTCNQEDNATIAITIKEIPQVPVASANPIVCDTQDLNLYATAIPNGVYHWSGPNGFTSSEQNPVLNPISSANNGTYTVHSSYNDCLSGNSSVAVLVNPLPEFVLNQDCIGREYQVWATKTNEASYNENTAVFSWAGPNNFTASQNPITITGEETGLYTLTIANGFGCEATNPIDVERTLCFIPNVITPNNDGANDILDLSGFNVIKLEIYNRWGRKVYERNNYLDEWHGQNMDGNRLPDSTYYYIIQMQEEGTKNGWIYLSSSK